MMWAVPAGAQEEGTVSTSTSTSSAAATEYADAGRLFYQNGQYVEALEAFQNAYAIAPTAALTFNIARCYEKLSEWSDAITFYEKYLELESNPRDRSEVLDKLQLLKERVGADPDSPEAQFEARMEAGRQAYGRGDYEAAIASFLSALELKQDADAVYNIAKSYERLARYEEAIDSYERYLELAPKASDRADVEATIKRLRKAIRDRYQDLSVSSVPAGADIYLDDPAAGQIGQTNFTTKVTPGPHTLYLELNGYEPVKREFVMPDDKPLSLDFQLKELENVGELAIEVNEPGARIFVDGAIVGLSPYGQKKKLEQGTHQVQVELPGYFRYSEEVKVAKNELTTLEVQLENYDPGISDGTLTGWGRNLLIVGVIGGTVGFLAPFIYQEFILERDYFDPLGPRDIAGNSYYKGPSSSSARDNNEFKTLQNVQIGSAIAGGTLAAAGLTFLIIKWARKKPPEGSVVTGSNDPGFFKFEVQSVGPYRTPAGGHGLGLTGRF